MNEQRKSQQEVDIEELYAESVHWHVNTGDETIHAKRMSGKWRTRKWLASSVWLVFFLGPYLRWGDRQAVLFDIPNRQFHLFGVTVLPQDFWMLSLLLLFFAILLAVVTATAGRVWCGFFCFQTVWTDIFTWIEEKLEGNPQKRRKLDKAALDFYKVRIKVTKHLLWLIIAFLTGFSFVAWFNDVYDLWRGVASFSLGPVAAGTIMLFIGGTYVLAGYLREQTCFWLCPYARIQGVMVDATTKVPTYDFYRGEPRGRVRKGKQAADAPAQGDCVDCNQCVAVCPTGVDIRNGQQEGCIMCGLCLDACDAVMEKLDRPKGLIRYESLEELEKKEAHPLYKRPRVWVYNFILISALVGIFYGLSTIESVEIKVIHERQPLYVIQSNGEIQNKYTLKLLNKLDSDVEVMLSVTGPKGLTLVGADKPVKIRQGRVTPYTLFVRAPRGSIQSDNQPITFVLKGKDQNGREFQGSRESVFLGPRT